MVPVPNSMNLDAERARLGAIVKAANMKDEQ
jgi:hypothetical protein